jgi:hypothetical protein
MHTYLSFWTFSYFDVLDFSVQWWLIMVFTPSKIGINSSSQIIVQTHLSAFISVPKLIKIKFRIYICKVDKILKARLDLISSPSSSVKIQIMDGKVCLRRKGKTLLGIVNKLLVLKCLLTTSSNVLPLHLNWIYTEGEGDGIESRLSS